MVESGLTPVLSRGASGFNMKQNGHPAVGSGTIVGPVKETSSVF